jgi:hypothetical protein
MSVGNLSATAMGGDGGSGSNGAAGAAGGWAEAVAYGIEQFSPGGSPNGSSGGNGGYAQVEINWGTISTEAGNLNSGTLTVTGPISASMSGINGSGRLVVGGGTNATTLQLNTTNGSTSTQSSVSVQANSTLNVFTDSTSTTAIGRGSTNNGILTFTGTGSNTLGGVNGTGTLVVGDGTNATTLQLSRYSGVTSVGSLVINAGSTLDITDNHMFINYGSGSDPMSTIYSYLKAGYNGGAWNGTGIISSTAQTKTNGLVYAIGFADGNDASGNGQRYVGLSSGQIELKYTLAGDANLDGIVNGTDLAILAANWDWPTTAWDQGNFHYGPVVNGIDLALLAANFNQVASGANVAGGDFTALDDFAAAEGINLTTVPEPASFGLLMLVALGGLAHRHRRGGPSSSLK